ncbi:MAG: Integrase catalytic protein [Acidobacteria bacterium]|nr:Integrase catalytic protein [Acidobacteriota bacterium]
MGPQARQEYLAQMRDRYVRASRREKGRLLTEAVTVTGYHRKALIRAWRRPVARRARGPRRGRPTRYDAAMVRALRAIWQAAGYPWSLRLKALLPTWLPWARRRLALSPATEAKVRAISARQMDRVLAPDKRTIRRRLYGRTKPGTLLKHHIPVKTDHWDVTEPGFTEVDLVSHSGDRADGDFLQSLNVTDIHTTWVETRAVMGKSQVRVQEALEQLRQALPFTLRGIDSDNGSEFINAHLYRYCRTHQMQFTRGRPYKKDDNAHIEQKNWTHVRKLMGYVRYDSEAARTAMNAVYADLRLLQNLFLPSVKLQRKERIGARLRRYYDAPQTPLERVRRCPQADLAKVAALVRQRDELDPFALAARIDQQLTQVYALANHRRGLVPSTLGGAAARAKTAPAAAPLPLKNAPPSVTPLMARRCAPR